MPPARRVIRAGGPTPSQASGRMPSSALARPRGALARALALALPLAARALQYTGPFTQLTASFLSVADPADGL